MQYGPTGDHTPPQFHSFLDSIVILIPLLQTNEDVETEETKRDPRMFSRRS